MTQADPDEHRRMLARVDRILGDEQRGTITADEQRAMITRRLGRAGVDQPRGDQRG